MAYPLGFLTDKTGYYIHKAANAAKDYKIDLSRWLGTDTLSSAVWTVPVGITKDAESITGKTAVIKLSGGTKGKTYSISCFVQTTDGNSDTIAFRVIII